jgi:hypothetical protein
MTTSSSPHLVAALASIARRHPVGRKLLVSPTFGGGRELLRRLSLEGLGWIGFEVVTPAPLALRLARGEMEKASLRAMGAFDQGALLDEALAGALRSEGRGLGLARRRRRVSRAGARGDQVPSPLGYRPRAA